jgi:uracil permease
MVPIFLASSFAFIAPIIYGGQHLGYSFHHVRPGGCRVSLYPAEPVHQGFRLRFPAQMLPPVVVGPVIMVIGLVLAPVAVHMAMGRTGDGAAWLVPKARP